MSANNSAESPSGDQPPGSPPEKIPTPPEPDVINVAVGDQLRVDEVQMRNRTRRHDTRYEMTEVDGFVKTRERP